MKGVSKIDATTDSRLAQNTGYIIGCILIAIILIVLVLPGQEDLHSSGPANTGHEQIACESCHVKAPGTVRQQLQANVRYYLGLRQNQADFIHQAVTNDTCLACHERPNNFHPPHRFFEPRFAEVRRILHPERCVSCHTEHQGGRVTHVDLTFCKHCHRDTVIKDDPITVPHDELAHGEDWETCLGCHDFHGNHKMEIETVVDRVIKSHTLIEYFNGGPSPYDGEIIYKAKEKTDE